MLEAVRDAYRSATHAGTACGVKSTGIGNGVAEYGRAILCPEADGTVTLFHSWTEMDYVDGKIDFMIAPVEVAKRGNSYARPSRVVLDKDRLADSLQQTSEPARPPNAAEFETCINWFFAAALMMAKCIVRGEPWMAKVREWDANTQLLQMIEWDHKARYGWDYDTWHLGAHMREWMDSEIVTAVGTCWPDFSTHNMRAALSASVALFDRLSARTATVLRIEQFDSGPVRREIDRLLGVKGE